MMPLWALIVAIEAWRLALQTLATEDRLARVATWLAVAYTLGHQGAIT